MPTCQSSQCGYIFWQNSNPCVVTIICNQRGQVLMTERGIEPDKGKLDLPGGFMKRGEDPVRAAHRETKEEIGVEIEIIELMGVETDWYLYQGIKEAILTFGYTAKIVRGKPHPADPKEISRVVWIDPQAYKNCELAFTSNKKFLKTLSRYIGKQKG